MIASKIAALKTMRNYLDEYLKLDRQMLAVVHQMAKLDPQATALYTKSPLNVTNELNKIPFLNVLNLLSDKGSNEPLFRLCGGEDETEFIRNLSVNSSTEK